MARTVTLPVKLELDNAWAVRPGDTLVVGFSRSLTAEEAHRITGKIADRLPGVEVITFDNVAAMTVYRPDPEIVATHKQATG